MADVIEYGMHIVGRNMRFIRKGNIKGLKKKIRRKSERKFGQIRGYIDDQRLDKILLGAAEHLEKSFFFWWRIEYAIEIYRDLGGYHEKAKQLSEELKAYGNTMLKNFSTPSPYL